jgi:hypothetical protein
MTTRTCYTILFLIELCGFGGLCSAALPTSSPMVVVCSFLQCSLNESTGIIFRRLDMGINHDDDEWSTAWVKFLAALTKAAESNGKLLRSDLDNYLSRLPPPANAPPAAPSASASASAPAASSTTTAPAASAGQLRLLDLEDMYSYIDQPSRRDDATDTLIESAQRDGTLYELDQKAVSTPLLEMMFMHIQAAIYEYTFRPDTNDDDGIGKFNSVKFDIGPNTVRVLADPFTASFRLPFCGIVGMEATRTRCFQIATIQMGNIGLPTPDAPPAATCDLANSHRHRHVVQCRLLLRRATLPFHEGCSVVPSMLHFHGQSLYVCCIFVPS